MSLTMLRHTEGLIPQIEEVREMVTVEIPMSKGTTRWFKECRRTTTGRWALEGVHVEVKDGQVRLGTTDGKRMIRYTVERHVQLPDQDVVLKWESFLARISGGLMTIGEFAEHELCEGGFPPGAEKMFDPSRETPVISVDNRSRVLLWVENIEVLSKSGVCGEGKGFGFCLKQMLIFSRGLDHGDKLVFMSDGETAPLYAKYGEVEVLLMPHVDTP